MKVKIIGEGEHEYPVLSIDRWKIYTLGMPSGGIRTVGADRLVEAPEGTGGPGMPAVEERKVPVVHGHQGQGQGQGQGNGGSHDNGNHDHSPSPKSSKPKGA